MEVCTSLPGTLCNKQATEHTLNVLCWDKFLRLTRVDDDTDWHDQFLARTYSEEEFIRKRKENVKKRSKSDTSSRHFHPQANKSTNNPATPEKSEKKLVRQTSTSYRHSLPGIIENGVYTEQHSPDRQSYAFDNVLEIEAGSNLDKKSASMSDLRNVNQYPGSKILSKLTATAKSQENLSMQGKDMQKFRPEVPLRDGISQRVSNVKRMLRLNGLMHAE